MALIGTLAREAALPADAAGPEPAGAIDPDSIERLRELDPSGEHRVLERVLQAYENTLSRHLAEMQDALAVGDSSAVMRTAHTLKSSSAAVGALSFSGRCAAVERAIRSGGPIPDLDQIETLLDEGRCVLRSVGAMLAARCGATS